jgi:uncharacterized protein
MERRLAYLPLHPGKAPAYLFQRMALLAGAMTTAIVEEYGAGEMLRRLADPWWFQAFGCVLGFDWHSSGVTTVTCGALKEAHRRMGKDLGIFVAGGKGATSRNTPREIGEASHQHAIVEGDRLIYASRMSAKVDCAAVQDGYRLYHHCFFFTLDGGWCVVQQGMNEALRNARRYHWLGERVDDFVCEPHAAVQDFGSGGTKTTEQMTLNMVAAEVEPNRQACADLIQQHPDQLLKIINTQTLGPNLFAPTHHAVLPADVNLARLGKIVRSAHETHPKDYEALLGTSNVGPATIRSLALVAELIYGTPISKRDLHCSKEELSDSEVKWADYSYAHGGKDGFPFPVDRSMYDRNILILTDAVNGARLGDNDRCLALKRLAKITS